MISFNWFDNVLCFFGLARFSKVHELIFKLQQKTVETVGLELSKTGLFLENKKLKTDLLKYRPIQEMKVVGLLDPIDKSDCAYFPPIQAKATPKKKGKKNASKSKSKKKG